MLKMRNISPNEELLIGVVFLLNYHIKQKIINKHFLNVVFH